MSAAKRNLSARSGQRPVVKTDRDGLTRCRVCGCTETDACAGSCSWVEEDLCSVCARAVGPLVYWFENARRANQAALLREVKRRLVSLVALVFIATSAFAQINPPPTVYPTNYGYVWLVSSNYGAPAPDCETNYLGSFQYAVTNAGMGWCKNLGWEQSGLPQTWLRYVITTDNHWFGAISNQVTTTGTETYTLCYTNPASSGPAMNVRFQVWAPTNVDPTATLQFKSSLTGHWNDWPNNNGQYYYDLYAFGETQTQYLPPPFWRAKGATTNDPKIKVELVPQ